MRSGEGRVAYLPISGDAARMCPAKDTGGGRGPLDALASKLGLPFGAPELLDRVLDGTADEVGRRTLHLLITTWDAGGGGPFAATSIGGVGLSKTVDLVQDQFGPIFEKLLVALGADEVQFRVTLCASQLVGLGVLRYAVKSEPMASVEVDVLVDAVAPSLQRYLTGDIH